MYDEIKQLAAVAALNKMMTSGHFSICTIRSIAEMFGIVPEAEAMAILNPLHCVDFAKMPRDLLASIPMLIQQALSAEQPFQFELKRGPELPQLCGKPVEKRNWLQRVIG